MKKRDEKSIEDWCIKYLKLNSYIINDNGYVDVRDSCVIQNMDIDKFPIKFGIIKAGFNCCYNNLITLENAPFEVNGNFICHDNKLTTLVGSPKIVDSDFYCYNNNLISLKGCTEIINGGFYCNYNKLTSLKWGPIHVEHNYNCTYNKLISLEGCPIKIGMKFLCEHNPVYDMEYSKYNNYEHYMRSIKLKGILKNENI